MTDRLTAIILGLLLPAASSFAEPASEGAAWRLPLSGDHMFQAGDDPAWAAPGFDDSAWRIVAVPGSLQEQGVDYTAWLGWYRLRFALPEDAPADLGVALGWLDVCADEVFLNGKRIGGSGVIGPAFFDVAAMRRCYPLPEGALRRGGENVLAVRLFRQGGAGGILDGPVEVGPLAPLRLDLIQRDRGARTIGAVTLFALGLSTACALALALRPGDRRSLGWLAAAIGAMFLIRLFYSRSGLELGFAGHGTLRLVAYPCMGVLPVALAAFIHGVLGRDRPRFFWAAAAFYGCAIALAVVQPGPVDFFRRPELMTAVSAACLPPLIYLGWFACRDFARAVRRWEPAAIPLLGGIAVCVAAVLFLFIEVQFFFFDVDWGSSTILIDGATLLLLGFFFGAAVVRSNAEARRLRELSARLLRAGEEERQRLSREVHDGVAQTLHGIRIKAQLLARAASDPGGSAAAGIAEIAGDLALASDELRMVARELRPDFLNESTLTEAMRWYGSHYDGQVEVAIRADGAEEPPLPARLREHLYRIFQEALSNASKHGGATRFEATLRREGGRISGVFVDDGSGFDAAGIRGNGIGLTTMRERAEIIGGRLTLQSQPGGGTRVEFAIPIKPDPETP